MQVQIYIKQEMRRMDSILRMTGLGLFFCFITATLPAQSSLFQNTYSTSYQTRMIKLFPGPKHGFLVLGDAGGMVDNYTLSGLDSAGVLSWSKQYFDSAGGQVISVSAAACSDGGLLLNTLKSPYTYSCLSRIDALGQIHWTKGYTGESFIGPMVHSVDNGFVYTGGGSKGELAVGKIDTSGTISWIKQFIPYTSLHYSGSVFSQAVAENPADSSILVVAAFDSPNFAALIHYDKHGNILWSDSLGGLPYAQPNQTISINAIRLFFKPNGNSILFFYGTTTCVCELSKSGAVIWSKYYSRQGTNNTSIYPRDISISPAGMLLLAEYKNDANNGLQDIVLFKTDTAGNYLWVKAIGGPKEDEASCLLRSSDNGILVGGNTYNYNTTQGGMYLVKTDSTGTPACNQLPTPPMTSVPAQLFTIPFIGKNTDQIPVPTQVKLMVQSNSLNQSGACTCTSPPQAAFHYDGWQQFIDLSVWATTWKYTYSDGGKDTAIMNPYHTFPYLGKFYVCLTVTNACGTSTFCDSVISGPLPQSIQPLSRPDFALHIFPNPSSGIIKIEFSPPGNETSRVSVFDLFGRPVFNTSFKDPQQEINLSFLPKGIYFIQVLSGEKSEIRKLILQ
jgi:hypothetical protein